MRMVFVVALLHAFGMCETRWKYLTFGPMFHLNFGDSKSYFSFAWEFAYWDYPVENNTGWFIAPEEGRFGYGVDLAVEFDLSHTRLYCEPQLGMALAGVSAGPVIEFSENKPWALGLQSSIWANWLLGADLRYRRINRENRIAPGLYIKAPVAVHSPPL